MNIVLTGSGGFLGWHTRLLAFSRGYDQVQSIKLGDGFDIQSAALSLEGADRLVHIAGVNRGESELVEQGNYLLAEQLMAAIEATKVPPRVVVYANSIQANLDNPYGRGKRKAGDALAALCDRLGIQFAEILLPNLFGEEGKPFYNSVVATFAHQIAKNHPPTVEQDRELQLLNVRYAARLLLDASVGEGVRNEEICRLSVSSIADIFMGFHAHYSQGEIPDISQPVTRDLFNAYRSASFMYRPEIVLDPKRDQRGFLVETLKSYGGESQTFFSTTKPGVTRGDHFHLRKVERFIVLNGEAVIRLRKMFTSEVLEFSVNGDRPTAIDMPIGWVHNITNVGSSELLTQFWTNEVFDPDDTDTFYEKVNVA